MSHCGAKMSPNLLYFSFWYTGVFAIIHKWNFITKGINCRTNIPQLMEKTALIEIMNKQMILLSYRCFKFDKVVEHMGDLAMLRKCFIYYCGREIIQGSSYF